MEPASLLVCGVVLMMVHKSSAVPQFKNAKCEADGKLSFLIKGANDYWLKTELCSNKIKITKNNADWVKMNGANCLYTLDQPFRAQLTKNQYGILYAAAGDISVTYECSGNGLPAVQINVGFTGPTQTTGPPIVVPVDPQISAVIFQGDCTTSVTSAVAAGDSLCLVIKIDDFSSFSMQVQTIKVRTTGSGWHVLTGGDNMPGCATQEYFDMGIWSQLEYFTPSHQRVVFPAFKLTQSLTAENLEFIMLVEICPHPSFSQCGNWQGCLPLTVGPVIGRRRRRDVAETVDIELHTSVTVSPGNGTVLDSTGGTSNSNTGGNPGDQAGQTGSDGEVAEQTGTEQCEVCMKRSVLYGLIGFFIPALVLAFGASACLWWRTKKQMKQFEETEIITRKSGSTHGSSFRNASFTR